MGAWTIIAWPPVLWQSPWPDMELRHFDTIIDEAGDHPDRRRGQSIWIGECAEGLAGIAWEWVQVQRGVVALSDPMSIVSNLRVVDEDECPVGDSRRALLLHTLVHACDWQGEVRKRLRERKRMLVTA